MLVVFIYSLFAAQVKGIGKSFYLTTILGFYNGNREFL